MPRNRQFDEAEVLDKAVDLLWLQGFEKTSIRELADATGIGMSSIYATFGDKNGLFHAAVRHYRHQRNQRFADVMTTSRSAIDGIRTAFSVVVEEMLNDPHKRGCLVVNSTTEVAPHDPVLAEIVADNRDFMVAAFRDVVERGQQNGEIDSALEAKALAQYLFNAMQGLRVVGKTNPDPQMLHNIVEMTLRVLEAR